MDASEPVSSVLEDFMHAYSILEYETHSTDEEIVRLLLKEEEHVIIQALSITTSPRLLQLLSSDKRASVKEAVAKNHYTPSDVLEQLVECEEEYVVECVANNLNASPDLLNRLASHSSQLIRSEVARNYSLPLETLYRMLDDLSLTVRLAASRTLKERPDSDYSFLPESLQNRALKQS